MKSLTLDTGNLSLPHAAYLKLVWQRIGCRDSLEYSTSTCTNDTSRYEAVEGQQRGPLHHVHDSSIHGISARVKHASGTVYLLYVCVCVCL